MTVVNLDDTSLLLMQDPFVPMEDGAIRLSDHLIACSEAVRAVSSGGTADNRCLNSAAAVLVAATRSGSEGDWLQLDFGIASETPATYERLHETSLLARDHGAESIFFMRKPPGLRLRLRLTSSGRVDVARIVGESLERIVDDGLIGPPTVGCYEPEEFVFGGPGNMRVAHRIFELDSTMWLQYLAECGVPAPNDRLSLTALASLAVLRAYDVDPLEELDVWNKVSTWCGRKLPGVDAQVAKQIDAFAGFVESLRRGLGAPPALTGPLDLFTQGMAEIAQALPSPGSAGATTGQRTFLALTTIFGWNRAGLTLPLQVVLTTALAATAARS